MVFLYIALGVIAFFVIAILWMSYRIYKNTFHIVYYNKNKLHYKSLDDYPYINKEERIVLDNKLHLYGALYSNNTISLYKGLIVFSHGIGPGQEPYMQEIAYFVKEGYLVYAFDVQGCGKSEGKYVGGYYNAVKDLDIVLTSIEKDEKLSSYPLYLIGHSMGGYAVNEMPLYNHLIKGIISISPCINPSQGLYDQMSFSMKVELRPFYYGFKVCDFLSFGIKGTRSNVKSLLNTDIPCLIIQGDNDETFSYKNNFQVLQDRLKEKTNIKFITSKGRMHHPLDSIEACNYEKESFKAYINLASEHEGHIPSVLEHKYYDELDYDKLYQLDDQIMSDLLSFLVSCE